MIYLYEDSERFEAISEDDAERIIASVPEAHRERILRYRRISDRLRSALCWGLLRYGIQKEYGIALPEAVRGQNGKLFFAEETGLHFNFSHCAYGVCCGIGNGNLGIDLQDVRPISDAVIRKCCSDREQKLLAASSQKNELFAELWSRKEAMGKAIGTGIAGNLRQLGWVGEETVTDRYFCSGCMVGKHMALAVCSEGIPMDCRRELYVFTSAEQFLDL